MKNYRYLILVPLHEEMKYLHGFLKKRGCETNSIFSEDESKYHFYYGQSRRQRISIVAHVIGDAGNVRSAAAGAASFWKSDNYDAIFLLGIAGSLDHEMAKLGDVIISNKVKCYYPDKVAEINDERNDYVFADEADGRADERSIIVDPRDKILTKSYLRYRREGLIWEKSTGNIDEYLHDIEQNGFPDEMEEVNVVVRNSKGSYEDYKNSPKIISGTILSGEMVVDSFEYVEYVMEKDLDETQDIYYQKGDSEAQARRKWHSYKPLAVDMETYGIFHLAHKVPQATLESTLLSVRGISDLASRKGDLDNETEGTVRQIAIHNASRTVLDFIDYIENRR